MRIYWYSNAPWAPTGYGNQTALFAPRLKALGHEVTLGTMYGLRGSPIQSGGMTVMPAGNMDKWGNDFLAADAQHTKADILITLMDVWVLSEHVVGQFRWCPWFPVDHAPMPPHVIKVILRAYQPICYSRFGVEQAQAAGFAPLYVPHGIDTEAFAPMDKIEARERLGIDPDRFVVGMVAANIGYPSRKCFDQNIRAFAELRKKHTDAMFYIHTDFPGVRGEKIARLIELAGLPATAIAQPNQYEYMRGLIGAETMRAVYNAMDVCTNATRGEGFGIPIMEAQSCGVPVIATDFSSMSELVDENAGWKLPVTQDDAFHSQESYQYIPKPSLIAEAMEAAYNLSDAEREVRSKASREAALAYDVDLITEHYWIPALEAIAARIEAERGEGTQFTGADCARLGHDWAAAGVMKNDEICLPCRRRGCTAQMRHTKRGWVEQESGFFETLDGIDMDIEDDPTGAVEKVVRYELNNAYGLAALNFKSGDWVVDLGAHVGVVSIYLALRHPEINILAVEPISENYLRLLRNIRANGVTNVLPLNLAVTGDGRDVVLYGRLDMNSGGVSAFASPAGRDAYRVKSITLDQLLGQNGIDHVRLLKVDIEGAEYEVFENADGALGKIDSIRAEFHTNRHIQDEGHTIAGLTDYLKERVPDVQVAPCQIAD